LRRYGCSKSTFYFQADNEVSSLSNWISVTETEGGVHACTYCQKTRWLKP